MGETCGLKMVYRTDPVHGNCPMCLKIATKMRKLEKAKSDYNRFNGDPARRATAEVKLKECYELAADIKKMQDERMARMNRVGNGRRADNRVHA